MWLWVMSFDIRHNKMDKNIIIVSLVILAVGGGAFFGGMKYQEGKSASVPAGARNFQTMTGGGQAPSGVRANRNGDGMIVGEIIAVDDDNVTVKSADGASKIVFFSEKTSIGNFIAAQADDLAIGQNITAAGTAGADGSIIAQNIQIGAPERSAGTLSMPTVFCYARDYYYFVINGEKFPEFKLK